jgi:hypothetical protein
MAEIVDLKPRNPDGPFVVGSTVCLRSGGALMTVRKPGKQSVIVDWTDANDNLCGAEFPPAMLRHADPDEEEKEAK